MKPFREAVSGLDMTLVKPALSPVLGAVLLAADHFDPAGLPGVKQGLLEN